MVHHFEWSDSCRRAAPPGRLPTSQVPASLTCASSPTIWTFQSARCEADGSAACATDPDARHPALLVSPANPADQPRPLPGERPHCFTVAAPRRSSGSCALPGSRRAGPACTAAGLQPLLALPTLARTTPPPATTTRAPAPSPDPGARHRLGCTLHLHAARLLQPRAAAHRPHADVGRDRPRTQEGGRTPERGGWWVGAQPRIPPGLPHCRPPGAGRPPASIDHRRRLYESAPRESQPAVATRSRAHVRARPLFPSAPAAPAPSGTLR